jgi:hypothetical protein
VSARFSIAVIVQAARRPRRSPPSGQRLAHERCTKRGIRGRGRRLWTAFGNLRSTPFTNRKHRWPKGPRGAQTARVDGHNSSPFIAFLACHRLSAIVGRSICWTHRMTCQRRPTAGWIARCPLNWANSHFAFLQSARSPR